MLIHLMRPIRSAPGGYEQGFFIVFIFFLTVSWLFLLWPGEKHRSVPRKRSNARMKVRATPFILYTPALSAT